MHLFDANADTPDATFLAGYHAVLVYSDYVFLDPVLLGDNLAAYHDQGGGVVVGLWANRGRGVEDYSSTLQGKFGNASNGYSLLDYSQGDYSCNENTLGEHVEPQSPLLAGVNSLSIGYGCWSTAPVVENRSVIVAKWGSGEPLVLRGVRGNRTLVELNFYPVSSQVDSNYYLMGDGAALLRNALKFSRCTACGPGPCPAPGEVWHIEGPFFCAAYNCHFWLPSVYDRRPTLVNLMHACYHCRVFRTSFIMACTAYTACFHWHMIKERRRCTSCWIVWSFISLTTICNSLMLICNEGHLLSLI